ncbi:plastocyanin/azurin family copper-binding protein [Haladaptatus sp. DYF46]|uniref:plastocyanin/azurin family copper-binding protein n=1 Tax=Haladaptatus sp. DYF46 TaxID=2886041 RepID=UPI003183AD34
MRVLYEHTFNTEGTYDYYCILHKTMCMIARIVVGKPGGPAEGSMPPDGKVTTSHHIIKQKAVAYEDQ